MIVLPVASAVERAGWLIGAATIVAIVVYFVVTFRHRDADAPLGS